MPNETIKHDNQQNSVDVEFKAPVYNQFGFFKVEFDPEYDAANGNTWDCDTNDLH